jgi:transmembrane sensor
MKNKDAKSLLEKFQAGTISNDELAMLESWYINEIKTIKDYQGLEDNIALLDQKFSFITGQPAKYKGNPWKKVAVAASIVACFGIGAYFYKHNGTKQEINQLANNDVAPGKNMATLILSNGRKIILSSTINGQLAKEAGVIITKTSDGKIVYQVQDNNTNEPNKINTLSTANGETYQVDLPDGSKVWLNAASSLKYPASFAAASVRRVELRGEAYFEVAKDKTHPFRVVTDKQEVTVLGTHFNINAYADEVGVKTTLLEGSVQVAAYNGNTVKIKPGEQAILKSNDIKVAEADIEMVMAWKNGDFIFKGEDLETAMLRVARWYNVEVVYEPSATKSLELGGWVSRSRNISAVLKMMESTGKVHFRIEGRRILVTK